MNDRLRYALLGGISYGLSFGIIVLIIGGSYRILWAFPEVGGIDSTIFLFILYEILVILAGIFTGNFFSFDGQRRKEIVRASTKAFIIVLGILVPLLIFESILAGFYASMYSLYDAYELAQLPQAEIDRELAIAQFYCGAGAAIIFGAIFGGIFGLAMPSTNRARSWLLGILLGALGFGLGGLFSGWVIPTYQCFEVKTNVSLWRLVIDASILGFLGGAGMGLFQQYTKSPKDHEGAVFNE